MSLNIARIEVNSTPGLVGLNIDKPDLEVSPRRDQIQISSGSGPFQVLTTSVSGSLEIDFYPTRADMGLLNISDRAKEIVQEGKQSALEGTARLAREGDRLMDFQNTDVADIARSRHQRERRHLEIAYKRGPEVNYEPAELEIKAGPGDVQVDTQLGSQLNRPGIELNWGHVQSYLRQEPDLEIIAPGVRMNLLA